MAFLPIIEKRPVENASNIPCYLSQRSPSLMRCTSSESTIVQIGGRIPLLSAEKFASFASYDPLWWILSSDS